MGTTLAVLSQPGTWHSIPARQLCSRDGRDRWRNGAVCLGVGRADRIAAEGLSRLILMTSPDPPRRRWFRYSLRTFFVVVTIFGVWLGYQVKWIRDRQEALDQHVCIGSLAPPQRDAPWPLRWFGEVGYHSIVIRMPDSQQEVARVGHLFPESQVIEPRNLPIKAKVVYLRDSKGRQRSVPVNKD